MSRQVNLVILVGNMVMDAKWSPASEKSQSRAYFKFAVNPECAGGNTVYMDVIAWNDIANAIAKDGCKGRELYIQGHMDSWNNKLQLVIDKVEFWAESKKQSQPSPQPLSSSEQPRQATPPPAAPEYSGYDDPDLYVMPDVLEEEEPAPAPEPEPVSEPEKEEEVTMGDREEIANFLAGAGLDSSDVKDMIVKLTAKKLEEDSRNRF